MGRRSKQAVRQPNVYEPKQELSINLYQDVSDHALELLWGQGFISKYEGSEMADKRFQELMKYNRVEELFPHLEKLLSLYGNIYVTIDMIGGKPTFTIADPLLNSQNIHEVPSTDGGIYGMGRAYVTDTVAVIWKRITTGTINFPVKEVWTKDKVERYFFGENNKQVTMAFVNEKLPADMQVSEYWEHNMGFIPVQWHKNIPTFGGLSYPDGYKGASLQSLVDKTLCELWHETETNRTRIIGNLDESAYNQLKKNGQLDEINKNDFLVNVTFKNSTGSAENTLIPVMGDPKFEQYWLSITAAKDQFYQLAGYSPLGDGNTEKTATENLLMKTGDYQTTKKKRNQRLIEINELLCKMIKLDIAWGFGDIYGKDIDSNITFEIMENKVMDSLQEITNFKTLIENDLMSKVEAIASFRGVSMNEAKEIYAEILKSKADEQKMLKSLGISEEKPEEGTKKEEKE